MDLTTMHVLLRGMKLFHLSQNGRQTLLMWVDQMIMCLKTMHGLLREILGLNKCGRLGMWVIDLGNYSSMASPNA
jgi:hypothetical protein